MQEKLLNHILKNLGLKVTKTNIQMNFQVV